LRQFEAGSSDPFELAVIEGDGDALLQVVDDDEEAVSGVAFEDLAFEALEGAAFHADGHARFESWFEGELDVGGDEFLDLSEVGRESPAVADGEHFGDAAAFEGLQAFLFGAVEENIAGEERNEGGPDASGGGFRFSDGLGEVVANSRMRSFRERDFSWRGRV
jgi:hypothetical protein